MNTAPKNPDSQSDDQSSLRLINPRPARHRRDPPPEEEGEGNWLVSYADLMTLLFGFFVVLQSFSTIDASKFEQLKKETTKVFGGEYQVPFEKLSSSLKGVVEKMGLRDQVIFTETDAGIDVTFRGALFFDSGSIELRSQARDLLDQLIPIIIDQAKDFGIVVEGHTDNVPVKMKNIASNWELSSLRSCQVVRLFEERGFDRTKLKALGWGDTRPILPNTDENGIASESNQAQNRRVVIKILKDFKRE